MAAYSLSQVTRESVFIKFKDTPAVSSIVNSAFTVRDTTSGTPVTISNPFKTIELSKDYDSLSRGLFLWWRDDLSLVADHTYEINISGLKDIFGNTLTASKIAFEVVGSATPGSVVDEYERPVTEPIEIEDHSIKDVPLLSTNTSHSDASSGAFRIISVSPDLESSYNLEAQENNGRITVEFNEKPAANFVNANDFKLLKRTVGTIAKWTAVNTVVALESDEPKVNIYLPSQDATPVYSFQVDDQTGLVFWEESCEYKLVLNGEIGY